MRGGRAVDGGADARVVLVAADVDALVAGFLTTTLRAAGVTIDAPPARPEDDVIVVLSHAAAADGAWRQAVESAAMAQRIVPVSVGPAPDTSDPALERINTINWISFDAGRPDVSAATVVAALRSHPELYDPARQLTLRAESWERSGQDRGLLATEAHEARGFQKLAQRLHDDPLFEPPPTVDAFVAASIAASKRSRHTRWTWRACVAATVVGVVATVAWVVPSVRSIGKHNRAGAITIAQPGMEDVQPAWSSLVAASLLDTGEAGERKAARASLHAQLWKPWASGVVHVEGAGVGLDHVEPFSDGRRAVIVFHDDDGSFIGIYDVPDSRLLSRTELPGSYYSLALSPDERTAVAVGGGPTGSNGIVAADLADGSVRRFPIKGRQLSASISPDGKRVLVVSEDDKATEVRIGDGETKDLGHFGAFLDAGWDDHARPVLLVNTSDDRYELVDARARRTVAAATVEDAVMPRGSLLPDGRSGLIASGDHQLWRLDRAGAEPTGIPNADRPGVVRSLPDGRVVVGGAAGPARVYDIDSAVDLGVVCREISYLVMVRSTHDGAMVSCLGPRQATLWPVPNGPLTRVSPDLPAQTELSGAGATITAEGSSVRVQSDGADEPTDVEVGLGRVTALALHPAGRQVLVATDRGEVRIVDMTAEPAVVVAWRVPDGSSGTGASWSGRPLVSTSAGAVWEAPTCPGCGTDDGMIAFLRTRLERCWTANNLAFVGDATRRRLGVEVCDAGNGD